MKHRLAVRSIAERDLQAARDWYESKQIGLGDVFLDEVAEAMGRLAHRPDLARPYYRQFHRILLRRFPYKLFYQVIDDQVIVFRVLHAKQSHESRLT